MTIKERDEIRSQIVMALECATAYVRDDESLDLAEHDITVASQLLDQILEVSA
jgi:hypothetical protein